MCPPVSSLLSNKLLYDINGACGIRSVSAGSDLIGVCLRKGRPSDHDLYVATCSGIDH